MRKRKYTKIAQFEEGIQRMRLEGKTVREIAEWFGLEKKQIKNWITRHNRAQDKLVAGIMPRPKGRPRKDALPGDVVAAQAYEINRLKMENKLLRDFLQLTGRK